MRYLSVLGDSLSTYKGVSNDLAANVTIGANPYHYHGEFPLEKTYWMQVAQRFGLDICVNNSWSSGNLSGRDVPHSGVNRANELARDDGTQPDIIIVLMGMNDLGRRVDPTVFAADYEHTLQTIAARYPRALVCCVTLPDRDPYLKRGAECYAQIVENAVAHAGDRFFVADLYHSHLNNDTYYMNTMDGLHPDEDGMTIIAKIVGDAIEAHALRA